MGRSLGSGRKPSGETRVHVGRVQVGRISRTQVQKCVGRRQRGMRGLARPHGVLISEVWGHSGVLSLLF